MEGSVPDSMLIREIDTLRAERDKAIADLERIEPFLREREEFGQWQADALCGMLKIERGPETMDEFNLKARWVKFSDRWPEAEETVLARDPDGDTIGAEYVDDDGCYVVFHGEYFRKDELNGWEWLEVREKGGEVFTDVVPARDWTREAFATMLIMQIVTMVLIFLNLEGGW